MFFVPLNQDNNIKFGSWSITDQLLYSNQNKHPKPQSGTSNILHSPKSGLKEHDCFLPLQYQAQQNSIWNRNPKIIRGGGRFSLPHSCLPMIVMLSELQTYSIAGKLLIGHACTSDAILC